MNQFAFFISGTDTDIGKTYISKLMCDSIGELETVTYMKPVQTGCTRNTDSVLSAPDFEYVMGGRAQETAPSAHHVPYKFEPACSPHLAAMLSGTVISLDYIRECYRSVSKRKTVTIVEGAGGIMAPLGDNVFMVDLIEFLKLPVILVTSPKLGTLNHTFLSINYLQQRKIPIAGVVFNNCADSTEDYIYHDNRRMIREFIHPVPFLEVPYGTFGDNQQVREFCERIRRN